MNSIDNTRIEKNLQLWSQALHDMSGRNRLLFYKDTKTSNATIELPSFFELFDMLVEKGTKLIVPLPVSQKEKTLFDAIDEDDLNRKSDDEQRRLLELQPNELQTNHSIAAFNKVISNLNYTSRTIREEQGFNILYITFGMIKWRESDNSEFSFAPMILVPIQVNRNGLGTPYEIYMAEDDAVFNPVLKTKLLKDFMLDIPEITNDLSTEQLSEYLENIKTLISRFEGWEILDKVTIGAFNFLTMLIIKDFENYGELYKENSIIQKLCGIASSKFNIPDYIPSAKELDTINPSTVYQILDADSSQQEAIEAAKRGLSFVLQGPPGTGKSQTISNIISEFLMADKKVLFVSQKMAALEVVQNRLSKRGLGDFCLEIHSHKMDKKRVIENLFNSLENTNTTKCRINYQKYQQDLYELRNELNSYVRLLHTPMFAVEISLFKAQGELANLLEDPEITFNIPDLDEINSRIFLKRQSLLKESLAHSDIIQTYKQNKWKGFNPLSITIKEKEEISDRFDKTTTAITEFCKIIDATIMNLNLPFATKFLEYLEYYQVFDVFHVGIFSEDLQSYIDGYLTRKDLSSRFVNLMYLFDILRIKKLIRNRKFSKNYISIPLITVKRILNRKEKSISDRTIDDIPITKLRDLYLIIQNGFNYAESFFNPDDMPLVLRDKQNFNLSIITEWFIEHSKHVNELSACVDFNNYIKECRENGLKEFIDVVIDHELSSEKWHNVYLRRFYILLSDRIIQQHSILRKYNGTTASQAINRFREIDLALIENTPHVIKEKLNSLKPKENWMRAASSETAILRKEHNKKRRVKPLRKLFQEIPDLIVRLKPCLMMSPLTICQLLDPILYKFDIVIFDEASQIPPEYAVSAFLRTEQIIVAGDRHQLPPTNFFQTIETDEYNDDEEYDDTYISFESILNACDSVDLPQKMLNWHYRSKDESLIAYSNYHFYGNRLFTFPTANSHDEVTGLKYNYIPDGIYKKGSGSRHNIKEAKKVVELVKEHLTRNPDLSLGIVTFSLTQRKAIEDELDLMRKEQPVLNPLFSNDRDEPIFIKNLENVQGDERDVIILSVGYGKDETGKMTMNFGPLNKEGGERRLNVAVTRARHSLKVVTSIQPEDIVIDRIKPGSGAYLLRNFLEIARDGHKSLFKNEIVDSDSEFDSPFEESVYNELTKRGIQLIPQVGVSQYRIDLGVIDPDKPGRFLLGIECDGAMYHSGNTARDRDRLRQQILEGLGWNIYRIWSRDWINNRTLEIDKVLKEIERCKSSITYQHEKEIKKESIFIIDDKNDIESGKIDLENSTLKPTNSIPYNKFQKKSPLITGGDALLNTRPAITIEVLIAIVEHESPISINNVKRRIVDIWKTKLGSNIEKHLDSIIGTTISSRKILVKQNFLWSINMINPPLRYHEPGHFTRSIKEIAPEEIEILVIECLKSSISILTEDLLRECIRFFGNNVSSDNKDYVGHILKKLIAEGKIKESNDKIKLS